MEIKIYKKIKIYFIEDFGFLIDYRGTRRQKYKFTLTKDISEKVKKFLEGKNIKKFSQKCDDEEFLKHFEKREKLLKKNFYNCLCGPCGNYLKKIDNKIILGIEEKIKSRTFGIILKKEEIEKKFLI